MGQTRFIYFDLGNVLLGFSHELATEQMARVAQCDYATVWDVVFGSQGLEFEYESGLISTEQFFLKFCERTNTQPNYDDFIWAGSAYFSSILRNHCPCLSIACRWLSTGGAFQYMPSALGILPAKLLFYNPNISSLLLELPAWLHETSCRNL